MDEKFLCLSVLHHGLLPNTPVNDAEHNIVEISRSVLPRVPQVTRYGPGIFLKPVFRGLKLSIYKITCNARMQRSI